MSKKFEQPKDYRIHQLWGLAGVASAVLAIPAFLLIISLF